MKHDALSLFTYLQLQAKQGPEITLQPAAKIVAVLFPATICGF
jgi:hypothetical protein